MQDATVRARDGDGHNSWFRTNEDHIESVRGEKLRAAFQHLLDGEVCTAFEFQESSIWSQGFRKELRLKLKLLQSTFTSALDLFEPFLICSAVLSTAEIV